MARRKSRSKKNTRPPRPVKSEINIVERSEKPKQSKSARNRANKKKLERQKKFRRRRLILALLLVLLVIIIVRAISYAINSYNVEGYPSFRDEVLENIGDEVFISSSEGRSLSAAEKVTDFDNFYKLIERNYAVDELNRADYEKFISQYNDYRKKVYSSKTDQEYFNLLNQYLGILDDTRTFILDKDTYDSLFNYHRNQQGSYRGKVLENPQATDRYKRLINGQDTIKPSMRASVENGYILRISLPDFKADEFKDDIKKIDELLLENPGVTTVLLDLSDNNSIDDVYRDKLASILMHGNYTGSSVIFYRGDTVSRELDFIKNTEGSKFKTPYLKNDPEKYPEDVSLINKADYMYYDEVSYDIEKDTSYSNRNIYVLTNSYTANEAIKLAQILKNSGAYLVKNGLDTQPTYRDVIYNMRSNLVVLEHSGLVLSINAAYSKNSDPLYLEYDQRINSKDPISSMLDIIN